MEEIDIIRNENKLLHKKLESIKKAKKINQWIQIIGSTIVLGIFIYGLVRALF